jgi:hypothetical protein
MRRLCGLALLVLSAAACSRSDTCVQVGPSQGYPLQPLDLFISAGYPSGQPLDAFYTDIGAEYVGAAPAQYPQVCYSAYDEDRPNYRWIGWVDTWAYRDGGQPPSLTYCADPRDAGCGPQPGQLHGEIVVTLHEGENNIVIIPLSL